MLEESVDKIAEIQTRPIISVSDATILFGTSKDTIRRLIKEGKIPAYNLGQRLTRVSRVHIEAMFTAVDLPGVPEEKPVRMQYDKSECYNIAEVSERFGISPSTANKTIRKYSIPRRQIGKYPKPVLNSKFYRKKKINLRLFSTALV